MQFNKCRLCNNNENLCKSHIIPEFFYKTIYEPGHVFYRMSSKSIYPKKSYCGLNESLLCKDCENILHEFENYVANIWFSKELKFYKKDGVSYFVNIDYKLFKLFQLSIIWRASISTLPEFSKICLGVKHELNIQQMLLNKDPGNPCDYGCILVHANDNEMQDIINGSMLIAPSFKISGHRVYPFVFGALIWMFYASSHLIKYQYANFFISKEGTLPIVNDPKLAEYFLKLTKNSLRNIKFKK